MFSPRLFPKRVCPGAPYHLTVLCGFPVSRWITTLTRASGTAALHHTVPTRLFVRFALVLGVANQTQFQVKFTQLFLLLPPLPYLTQTNIIPFFDRDSSHFWYFIMIIGKIGICCYLVFASALIGKSAHLFVYFWWVFIVYVVSFSLFMDIPFEPLNFQNFVLMDFWFSTFSLCDQRDSIATELGIYSHSLSIPFFPLYWRLCGYASSVSHVQQLSPGVENKQKTKKNQCAKTVWRVTRIVSIECTQQSKLIISDLSIGTLPYPAGYGCIPFFGRVFWRFRPIGGKQVNPDPFRG